MPNGAGAAIGGLLCGLIVGIAIGTLIGAVILRAAIAMYNKLAGGPSSPSSVPEPEFGKAMLITFVTSLVQFVGGAIVGAVIGAGAVAAGDRGQGPALVAQLISFPVGLLIMAGMLSAMLPTTFGRAFLITLCYMVVVVLIVLVIAAIMIAFGVALMRGN